MIDVIRRDYGLDTPSVFAAMLRVPREEFTPDDYKEVAYDDRPIPLGNDSTMSQPYTVAFMSDLLDLKGNERVLEIGTGSGYQAAILAELAGEVYTVEIIKSLAEKAKRKLKELGYKNVHVRAGSGEQGWRKHAPYDAIVVTAGMEEVPEELFEQLKKGGVLVAPVGKGRDKTMTKYSKSEKSGKIKSKKFGIFHFVPFVKKN